MEYKQFFDNPSHTSLSSRSLSLPDVRLIYHGGVKVKEKTALRIFPFLFSTDNPNTAHPATAPTTLNSSNTLLSV